MVELLFVHGALVRDGGWWWHRVAELMLRGTGVPSRVVALPSCGEGAPAGAAGLLEDAQALRAELDRVDEAIVVGHSYGGTVLAEGADHPAVRHLVYISSYLPEAGSSQAAIMDGEPDPVSIAPNDDGTLGLTGFSPDSFAERFLQDVPEETLRSEAWHRVTTQSAGAFLTPTTRAAWQGRTSTYVVCAEDRSTSVELQRRHAERATASIELPTGHHPFLSAPGLVAEILNGLVRG